MQNYLKSGEIMTFTAPSPGVTVGVPVLIGNILAVPQNTVATGLTFEGVVEGVLTLPKATGQTWAEGVLLYWDDTAKKITTTSTSNYRVGCAGAAAASGDTTGMVRLTGTPVPTGA